MLDETNAPIEDSDASSAEGTDEASSNDPQQAPQEPAITVKSTRRRVAGRPAGPPAASTDIFAVPAAGAPQRSEPDAVTDEEPADDESEDNDTVSVSSVAVAATSPLAMFQAPPAELAPALRKKREEAELEDDSEAEADVDAELDDDSDDDEGGAGRNKRRRRRGGRRRRKSDTAEDDTDDSSDDTEEALDEEAGSSRPSRRRRRRARAGEEAETLPDDPENTVVKVREGRSAEDEIAGVSGSTRLEAKKQRRREGREAGRRRAPIVTEAEFLARREAVNREMVVRQGSEYTQIAVLEDDVLVEHYVARESQTSLIGNVYIGKVQNVLPSMEAAFVDIGEGRNAVIYAGEVDWSSVQNGKQRKIEDALAPGQTIVVQVTKDPIGQKGARLSSQVSLPGRFLVYVPGGGSNGISRKLPDSERARLKTLLKEVLPESAGVIVRTAAEGATEDQLTRDVEALTARWSDIESKIAAGNAPQLLYSEPDLMIKVIRDLFNEDFAKLTVSGEDAWDMVSGYVAHVAPDLEDRVERWEGDADIFAARRLDEQIHKGLDRKVHLPSGGSLVIDRTEAMTVVDVNTGRFTGSGGNLEETVTKNNLEAAEEIVRQLRLRDIGGIVVIDFIDMVLESNRDLVLRRLVECLGRDRTRHQVAEVTSLGLVQMTRKRIGTGLVESFSHECDACKGRGIVLTEEPIEPRKDDAGRRGRRGGRGRNKKDSQPIQQHSGAAAEQARRIHEAAEQLHDEDMPDGEVEDLETQDEAVEVAAEESVDSTVEVPVEEPTESADDSAAEPVLTEDASDL